MTPKLIHAIKKIKSWEEKNLPVFVYESSIGYSVFLEIALLNIDDEITLKNLYLSLNSSECTARFYIRQLEKDCWIDLLKCSKDRRNRLIKKADKFEQKIVEWERFVTSTLNELHHDPSVN
jgi:hypothetical protein